MFHRALAHWRPATTLAVLGALLLTLTGASGLWSDSGTVAGNTVQAGTISLDLRAPVNKPIASNLVVGDPIHGVGGLLPGQSTDPGKIELYNDGTQSQKQYLHITNKVGPLCDWVTLTLGRDWDGLPISFDESIGTYPLAALEGQANRISVGRTFGEGPGVVPDNFTTVLAQKANLDVATPNSFNGTGATCTWDEVFTAEQVGP